MMNKRYTIFHLPFLAFFSKELYRDVGKNWKGANFAYLFLLLAICWVPSTLSLRKTLINSLDNNSAHLINQLPDIHIKKGQVELNQQKPYLIKNRSGQTVAIIDTTGSMNYIQDEHVMVLLTASDLIVRRGKNEFNTLNLSQVSEFHLNKALVNQWLQTSRNALAPLSYGLFLLLSYIFAVLAMLLTALVGLAYSTAMHRTLKFSGVLRIAVAAATPSILLITVSSALGQSIAGWIYIAFTLFYLLIGITSCSKPAEEQEEIPRLKLSGLLDEATSYPKQTSKAA